MRALWIYGIQRRKRTKCASNLSNLHWTDMFMVTDVCVRICKKTVWNQTRKRKIEKTNIISVVFCYKWIRDSRRSTTDWYVCAHMNSSNSISISSAAHVVHFSSLFIHISLSFVKFFIIFRYACTTIQYNSQLWPKCSGLHLNCCSGDIRSLTHALTRSNVFTIHLRYVNWLNLLR